MKIVKGNLWDSKDNTILVTTNSFIKKDGALVMGRGAALEMKTKYPGIDYSFGRLIYSWGGELGKYGLILFDLGLYGDHFTGAFQVKYHFKDKADLDLIKYSTDKLIDKLLQAPWIAPVSMNFPAIGNGGLIMEEVLPIVQVLPDTVSLYVK